MSYNLRNRQVSNDNSAIMADQQQQQAEQQQQQVMQAVQRLENDLRNLAVRPSVGQLPATFSARPGEDPTAFIDTCVAWCHINGQRDATGMMNVLQLVLKGPASDWLKGLADEVRQDVQRITTSFKDRFVDNAQNLKWLQEQQLLGRLMTTNESLEDYIFHMDSLCSSLKKSDEDRVAYFVRGLIPSIRPFVMQQRPQTWKDAVQAARLAALSMSSIDINGQATAPAATALSSSAPSSIGSSQQHQQLVPPAYGTPTAPASSSLYTPQTAQVMAQPGGVSTLASPPLFYGGAQPVSQLPSYVMPMAYNGQQVSFPTSPYNVASPTSSLCMAPMPSLNLTSMPYGSLQQSPGPYAPNAYATHDHRIANTVAAPPSSSSSDTIISALVNTVGEIAQSVKQLQQSQQSDTHDAHVAGISSRNNTPGYTENNAVVCQLCGRGYHSARACNLFKTRNKYNNANTERNNSNFDRNYYGSEGKQLQPHYNKDAHIICYRCNNKGHREANCKAHTHLNK